MNTIYFFIKKITICLIFLGMQTIVAASDPTQPTCNNCSNLTLQNADLTLKLENTKKTVDNYWKLYDEQKDMVEKLTQEKLLEYSKNHADKIELEQFRRKQTELNAQEARLNPLQKALEQKQVELQQQLASNNEKCDAYQEQLATNNDNISKLKEKIESLQNINEKLNTVVEKENTRHKEEILNLQTNLNKYFSENIQLKKSLKTEQDKSKKLTQELKEVVSAKTNAEQEIATLTETLALMKMTHEREFEAQKISYEDRLNAQEQKHSTDHEKQQSLLSTLEQKNKTLVSDLFATSQKYTAASEQGVQNLHFFGYIYKQLCQILGKEEVETDFTNLEKNITNLLGSVGKNLSELKELLKQKQSPTTEASDKQIFTLQKRLLLYQIAFYLAGGTAIVSLLMLLRMKMQSGHA